VTRHRVADGEESGVRREDTVIGGGHITVAIPSHDVQPFLRFALKFNVQAVTSAPLPLSRPFTPQPKHLAREQQELQAPVIGPVDFDSHGWPLPEQTGMQMRGHGLGEDLDSSDTIPKQTHLHDFPVYLRGC